MTGEEDSHYCSNNRLQQTLLKAKNLEFGPFGDQAVLSYLRIKKVLSLHNSFFMLPDGPTLFPLNVAYPLLPSSNFLLWA